MRTQFVFVFSEQGLRRTEVAVANNVWMSGEQRRAVGPGIGHPGTTGGVPGTAGASATAAIAPAPGAGIGRNAGPENALELSLEGLGDFILPAPFAVHESMFLGGGRSSASSLAQALSSTFATSPSETQDPTQLEQQLRSRQHDLHTPEPVASTPPAFPLPSPTAGALLLLLRESDPIGHHMHTHTHFDHAAILIEGYTTECL